jgi:hypothetical protein
LPFWGIGGNGSRAVTRARMCARVSRPGVLISLALLTLASLSLAACGPREPSVPGEQRAWEGPGNAVASSGAITYERREIAQKAPLPACITVNDDRYGFVQITPFAGGGSTPPGLTDTFYRLDRWRLWTRGGPPEGQESLFVTIRGSTGIVAEYARVAPGEPCGA